MEIKIKHSTDCKKAFANYDLSCPRCVELSKGAKPRKGWNDGKREAEANLIRAIRAHDCTVSGCGPVCTRFEW